MNATVSDLPITWPAMSLAEAHRILTAPGARFEMIDISHNGVPCRTWKNAPATVRDLFLIARGYGERVFVAYEDQRVTYEAFARATLTLAKRLEELGVRKGDRVAIAMRNLPEWPVSFFAASLCGAIVAPLNAWWTADELAYGLKDSGAKVVLVDAERYARIEPLRTQLPALEHVLVAGEMSEKSKDAMALRDWLGVPNDWAKLPDLPLPAVELSPQDDASIFYTSGTTGKPKGALSTHMSAMTNTLTGGCVQQRAYLRRGEAPPVVSPSDPQRVMLLAVPLFHVTGAYAWLVPAMFNGSRLIMMHKWDAEKALQIVERERVTQVGGVPTIAWQLVQHPDRSKYDLSSLAIVSYGGAPSAPELVRRIKSEVRQATPMNGWGMTEVSGAFMGNGAEDYEQRPDSCGPAPAVGELKIMNAEGSGELPCGEVGELWVRGPQVIKGFWNNPKVTAESMVDGWFKTGDLARVDAEGFCFLVDRAKDMLIRGGENIYCVQVENVLYEHPAVMDVAVVGIPHLTLGEEPGAVVHLKPGAQASEDELRKFAATKLAAFQVPVRVAFWSDPLPRNPAGKILKRELKSAFAAA